MSCSAERVSLFLPGCISVSEDVRRMYSEKRAKLGWASFSSVQRALFQHVRHRLSGMPRRYFDPPPQYHSGKWFRPLARGCLPPACHYLHEPDSFCVPGEPAPANPWGGKTLEWTVPSPPPVENFAESPLVTDGPYAFDKDA